jgi:Zn-dependent M28 family amino/carboxypeptidase
VGAHKDHVGYNHNPIDHDSARVVYLAEYRAQMEHRNATERELTVNMDSLRQIRPPRRDSIFNGADDDGSGSMGVLEIAEALANAPTKPARSILFVWHTGEEDGLLGSAYYTSHPTVPRDSIIAQINIDMIGRGTAQDVKDLGGPDYLIVVGHRRMSQDLGDVIEAVNARQPRPFRFDLAWDAPNHPEQIYGRSDHANYARIGIPVAFFFTGLHADYHQITDEPQYIDYPHYTRIVQYLNDVVVELANRPERVKRDR